MALQIENDKDFLILKVDKEEMNNIHSPGICDSCATRMKEGYYIAALNCIHCETCYNEWYKDAIFYASDRHIEEKRFNLYIKAFNGTTDNTPIGF